MTDIITIMSSVLLAFTVLFMLLFLCGWIYEGVVHKNWHVFNPNNDLKVICVIGIYVCFLLTAMLYLIVVFYNFLNHV